MRVRLGHPMRTTSGSSSLYRPPCFTASRSLLIYIFFFFFNPKFSFIFYFWLYVYSLTEDRHSSMNTFTFLLVSKHLHPYTCNDGESEQRKVAKLMNSNAFCSDQHRQVHAHMSYLLDTTIIMHFKITIQFTYIKSPFTI